MRVNCAAPLLQCQEQHREVTTSKWQGEIYQRANRNKRSLHIAGYTNGNEITNYFKILNQEDMLRLENLMLKRKLLANMTLCKTQENPFKNLKFSNLLQELVDSAIMNAGRKDGGKRYTIKLVVMSTHIFILGGLQLYELLFSNLPIPSVTRVRQQLSSQSHTYEGCFRFKELAEFLAKENLPKRVNISEDGTKCENKAQYHRQSNQIVGFTLPLDSNGLPKTGSYPATSAQVIAQYFEENTPASYVYCLIAQPLADNAPSFCLALFGTDNKFTANDVKARWKWMVSEAAKHDIEIVCGSSDGDTRLLSAMCSLMFVKKSPEDWFFSELLSLFICIQDHVHIGTKLKSRLLSPSLIMALGKYLASRGHLVDLVKIASKDLHCLTMNHLDPKDKMNFRSVQIMTDPQVISLLRETCKDAEGTAIFLEMIRSVVNAFTDKNLSAIERVELIWKWVFFLRIWRQWLKDHPGYSVSHNFISLNSYYCIEINAHALIHMIRKFRDAEEPHLFLVWLSGSQPCEDFFRGARSMTTTFSTIVNFTVLDLQYRVKRIDFLNEAKCKLKEDFVFPRSKRAAKDEPSTNSVNTVLPEDIDIEHAIASAKKFAIEVAIRLGMMTKRNAKIPPMELPKVTRQSKKASNDDEGIILCEEFEDEDEDRELVNEQCSDEESENDDEENPVDVCDECDVEQDLLVVSTGALKLKSVEDIIITPECPFVKVLDGTGTVFIIRKSTLCWLLSSGSIKLSADRLQRVKDPVATHTTCRLIAQPASTIPSVEEEISIADWCAFKSEDDSIVIGHIHAFSYSSGSTWKNQEYSGMTVPTTAPSQNARGVGCLCTWYKLLRNKKLQEISMDVHGYYDVSNYVCTVPRPKISRNQFIMSCSLADILKAK